MRKDYFSWKKFEMQKNNAFKKFYFYPNFVSYRFVRNFKKVVEILFPEKIIRDLWESHHFVKFCMKR